MYCVFASVILAAVIAALLYVAVTLVVPSVAQLPLFKFTVYVDAPQLLLLKVYPLAHVAIVHTLLTDPFDHAAVSHVATFAFPQLVSQLVLPVPLVVPFVPVASLA